MPSKGELPTIFAQRTERNERISSLLSSVLMRSINPQFTYAIRRHPLSLWTTELCINVESKNDKQGVPTVLFVENTDASNSSIRTISRILKKEASESGLLVAVHSIQSHSSATVDDILKSFDPKAMVFLVSLCSGIRIQNMTESKGRGGCLSGLVMFDPKSENQSSAVVPKLVLLSKEEGPNDFSSKIHLQTNDPHATIISLPENLSTYGDDGANSLWMARLVLKWMKAVKITSRKNDDPSDRRTSLPLQSRL